MSFQKLIRIGSSGNQQQFLNLLPANRLCSANSLCSRPSVDLFSRTLCSQTTSSQTAPKQTASNQTSSDQSNDKLCSTDGEWHISAGLVIQRYPVLTPELNVIEKSFQENAWKLEYARSLLSDYDYAIDKVKNEGSKLEKHLQIMSKYENYLKEMSTFKFGGKRTPADEKNDLKSYERCLDRSLYLVTNMTVGKEPVWTFPFASLNKEDDSLREACDRLLKQINEKAKFRILGNSPFTYLKYSYPKKIRERLDNKHGNKIFFFKCQLVDLKHEFSVLDTNLFADFVWLNTDECKQRLSDGLWRSVKRGLLAENMDELLLNIVNEKLNEKKLETASG